MPTAYTADVGDGEISDLATFALRCARQFGALVAMRDDDLGAPIPEFVPSNYETRRINAAKAELDKLRGMSETEIIRACMHEHAETVAERKKWEQDRLATKARYEGMLAKVVEWQAPSAEHAGLKEFMESQLRESIRFDCGHEYKAPEPVPVDEWYANKMRSAADDVLRAQKGLDEERERCRKRNEWVQQLKESLK
jgi:hypothetical protein